MINYYYYNHFGSSKGEKIIIKKKSKGFIWKLNAQFPLTSIWGRKRSWYLQRPRKQLWEDKTCWEDGEVLGEVSLSCGLAAGAGNSADSVC